MMTVEPNPIHPQRDAGPPALQALRGFHRSIRASLQVLDETTALASAGMTDVIKASALNDFFRGPMHWHDEDEGSSLLPRLLEKDPSIRALVAACSEEHAAMERTIDRVLGHLRSLSDGGEPDPELLRRTAIDLRAALEPHLRREEEHIFPAALRYLTPAEFTEMSLEMRARRLRRQAT